MCKITLIVLSSIVVFISGCGEDAFVNGDGDSTAFSVEKISQNGAVLSHTDERRGKNCMGCHKAGNNPYVYNVAGTVYQTNNLSLIYPNALIKIYSGPNGTGDLLELIKVDANGNFYSTQNVDFSVGVYPSVEGTEGEQPRFMGSAVKRGDCNSCHGVSNLPINVG